MSAKKEIVRQAGAPRAVTCLNQIVEDLDAYLLKLPFDNLGSMDTTIEELGTICSKIVDEIESIRNLNLSQLELDANVSVDDPSRATFHFTSRYSGDERRYPTNFTDLDALARNVVIDIWTDYQMAVN